MLSSLSIGAVAASQMVFRIFPGVLYHGDLIEKLKLLYKMHVVPGGCSRTHSTRQVDLQINALVSSGSIIKEMRLS